MVCLGREVEGASAAVSPGEELGLVRRCEGASESGSGNVISSVCGTCGRAGCLCLCLCLLGACRLDIDLCPCHGRDLGRTCRALDCAPSDCCACLVLVIAIFCVCGHRPVWGLCCSHCVRRQVVWSPAGVVIGGWRCGLRLDCRDGVVLLVVRPWLYSRLLVLVVGRDISGSMQRASAPAKALMARWVVSRVRPAGNVLVMY